MFETLGDASLRALTVMASEVRVGARIAADQPNSFVTKTTAPMPTAAMTTPNVVTIMRSRTEYASQSSKSDMAQSPLWMWARTAPAVAADADTIHAQKINQSAHACAGAKMRGSPLSNIVRLRS